MPKYKIIPIEELPELLTVGQVSHLLGCHANTIRNWENDGKIQAVRIGTKKHRRFKKSDIQKLIDGQSL